MSQTPTPEIRRALYGRLLECLPILGLEKTDVAWPNAVFKPVLARPYLKPFCLFNETELASLSPCGFERLSGIFQITVFGVADTGEGEIEESARVLTDCFRGGTILPIPCFNPLLIATAWRGPMRMDGERPSITVSARFRQYAQKGGEI